jgi:hypothetical protein
MEAGWTLQSVWTQWRRENYLNPAGNQTPAVQPTELSQFLNSKKLQVLRVRGFTSPRLHPLSHHVIPVGLEFVSMVCFKGDDRWQDDKYLMYFKTLFRHLPET